MSYFHTEIFDQGLEWLKSHARMFYALSGEPSYVDMSAAYVAITTTLAMGSKNISGDLLGPSDALPSGRKLILPAFNDGTVTVTGTPNRWAIVDDLSQLVLVVHELDPLVPIGIGSPLELPEDLPIRLPGLAG